MYNFFCGGAQNLDCPRALFTLVTPLPLAKKNEMMIKCLVLSMYVYDLKSPSFCTTPPP